MAHIVVLGGTGFVGRNIVHEAAARGHSIDVISHTRVFDGSTKDAVTFERGSIFDVELIENLARGADVMAIAVPAREIEYKELVEALPPLLTAASEHGVRLAFVGSAGSLNVGPDGPRYLDTEDFPSSALDEAKAHAKVLAALQESDDDVDWFYLSPSAQFGATHPGQSTEVFRLGVDELLTDEAGNSSISGADYAHAFVDEIDRPQHSRSRFTVGY